MSRTVNLLHTFESFRFEPKSRKLWRDREVVILSPKAAALLTLLIENAGEFVSKEEIFETIWADTFVEDGVLTQNIYSLRKTLGTTSDGSLIIENKTRLGYRFAAPIETRTISLPTKTGADLRPRSRSVWVGSMLLILLALGVSAFFAYRRYSGPTVSGAPSEPVSLLFRPVTNSGDIVSPALSPEGDFAAYAREKALYLKDLKSNTEIKIDVPGVSAFSSVQFSADGSSLLFRPQTVMRTDADILKTTRFGGAVQVIAQKTWGSFGVSSDGAKIAFGRNHPNQTAQTLVIKNLHSGEETTITSIQFPEIFLHNCSPVWSPNDKVIAFVTQNYMARQTTLYLIDVATGVRREVKTDNLKQFEQIGFMPDGETMIASASEGGRFYHLWKIVPGQPNAQRLTNGLTSFGEISFAKNGTVLALQTTESPGLYVANAAYLKNPAPLENGLSEFAGQTGLEWIDEENLVYSSFSIENPMSNLVRMQLNGRQTKALTTNREFHSDAPTSSADGNNIFFTSTETPFINIKRIDGDGGKRQAITNGTDGYRIFPQVTQNGRFLYYIFRSLGGGDVIRRDLTDNSETVVVPRSAANPVGKLSLSADGSLLAFVNWGEPVRTDNDEATFRLGVVSVNDPHDIRFFDVKLLYAALQIAPDNAGLDYVSFDGNTSVLVRQPLDGGSKKELLRLPGRRLYNFAWSKRGKRLALSLGVQQRDAVLLTGF